MPNGDPGAPEENSAPQNGAQPDSSWRNPIVLIAFFILGAVGLQVLLALRGWDQGVMEKMGHGEYARGFITYLFAMVTIGTAVVLVVSALTGLTDRTHFERGKEVLAVLLGVFGTIVGFYFGSSERTVESLPQIAALRIAHEGVGADSKYTVTTFVNGGKPPYKFAFKLGDAAQGNFEQVPESGWIVKELPAKQFPTGVPSQVAIEVQDSDGKSIRQSAVVVNQP